MTFKIPADELELLVQRFGNEVRQIGRWNKTTDGSLEVPMNNITEAARKLDDESLTEAVQQLQIPEQFSDLLSDSSAAVQFIEALVALYIKQFESKVLRYQDSNNPAETERLRQEIHENCSGGRLPKSDWAALFASTPERRKQWGAKIVHASLH